MVNTFLSKGFVLCDDGNIVTQGMTTFNEHINADKMIISQGGIADGEV